jgi:hypothetical protein
MIPHISGRLRELLITRASKREPRGGDPTAAAPCNPRRATEGRGIRGNDGEGAAEAAPPRGSRLRVARPTRRVAAALNVGFTLGGRPTHLGS